MPIKLANNASSRLSSPLAANSTTLSVNAGQGSMFPTLAADDWFPMTIVNSTGLLEIVRCTARAGDVFTIVRGQEGTTPKAFSLGDRVELRLTAGTLEQFIIERFSTLGNSATRDVGTTAGTVAAGDDSRITGAAQKDQNLADLPNKETARSNLGLKSAALAESSDFWKVSKSLGSTNLDTLGGNDNQGPYHQTTSSVATTALGYPVGLAGSLLVLQSAYGCEQVYIPYDGSGFWVRGLTGSWNGSNGPWSTWKQLNHWDQIAGKPAQATRWPVWGEVTGRPATADRWPTWAEVSSKPTVFPTNWGNVSGPPATATRWPTWAEVTGKPAVYSDLNIRAVGTYCFVSSHTGTNGTWGPGATIPGAHLREAAMRWPRSGTSDQPMQIVQTGTNFPGTWRIMGGSLVMDTTTKYRATLAVRIS